MQSKTHSIYLHRKRLIKLFFKDYPMEIQEIKNKLTLRQVLTHYHLKPDKNHRLNCPFHKDKTPSLQVYYKTHTAYCFSSNCKTHGKSLDVIDFIMHMENGTKHEAILKAKAMINPATSIRSTEPQSKTATLTKLFTYFKNGVHNSKPAKEYLEQRGLDFTKTEVGYNSGQFHHGKRKDEELIKSCIKYGILIDLGTKGRTGNPAYKPFGKWCIVFAMRDQQGQITGLYFRSTLDDKSQSRTPARHFYLKDRQGLYPNYPSKDTRKLILTESIIDAATLLEQEAIKSQYEVLAMFGTNGLTDEHQRAIRQLKNLEEIIFFLDGDQAGSKAVEKYAPLLKTDYPTIKISQVETPENEDINSLLQGHEPQILTHLIETRKDYNFLFSTEHQLKEKEHIEPPVIQRTQAKAPSQPQTLNTSNPYNLKYTGNQADYQIKGFKINQLDSLRITLKITTK